MTDKRINDLRSYVSGKHPASEVPMTAGELQDIFAECDALKAALRTLAIVERSGNALHPWSCQLCSWEAWSEGEAESHAPGCLAAPDAPL